MIHMYLCPYRNYAEQDYELCERVGKLVVEAQSIHYIEMLGPIMKSLDTAGIVRGFIKDSMTGLMEMTPRYEIYGMSTTTLTSICYKISACAIKHALMVYNSILCIRIFLIIQTSYRSE